MSEKLNLSTLLLLILIAVVGVFTLDVYLPGMPAMADQFDVSMKEIAYTFTGFSIVFAFSQLIHGAISDCIGRKTVLLVGLSVAAFATLCCLFAQSYKVLFIARVLQAVGISSFVVVNAIIRDLYIGSKAVQVRAIVATASGVSISIAPTIGGLLQGMFSWKGGFIASFFLIVGALAYAVIFFRETNLEKSPIGIKLKSLTGSYLQLYRDKEYLSHVLMAMLAYTVHFTFIIMSADIFIKLLGATPLTFGYLMIVYGVVYFLGGLYAGWIAKTTTISALIQLGSSLIAAGGIVLFLLQVFAGQSAWQVLLPVAVITAGVTMVRAASITGALAPLSSQAGQGAAGLNLVQFAVSALIATAISSVVNSHPQICIAMLAIASALSIEFLRRRVAI